MKDYCFLWLSVFYALVCTAGFSEEPSLAQYYGFDPIEVIKVDAGISSLNVCDFNQDGLNDLALINNRRSRIELFIRKDSDEVSGNTSAPDQINDLPTTENFDQYEILLSVKLSSLVTGDFNHDGRIDLAGYGQPSGLYLFYQDEPTDNGQISWKSVKKVPAQDAMQSKYGLASGDLNQDGYDDLVLAADNSLYLFFQPKTDQDFKPVQIASSQPLRSVNIFDYNHDGMNDIVALVKSRDYPMQIRYGLKGGSFSPVYQYELQALMDYEMLADSSLIFYVEQLSGRLTIAAPDESEQSGSSDYNVLTYPLSQSNKATDRDMVFADVDGNGMKDVVVSFPEEAKIELYLQTQVGLSEAKTFPSFSEITQMHAADVDGDGKDEIVLLSTQERTIGVTQYEQGRMTFPEPLKTMFPPVTVSVSDVYRSCICIVKDPDKDEYKLLCVSYDPGSDAKPDILLEKMHKLDSDPAGMKMFDIDHNGLDDLILFRGYDEPLVYLQNGPYQFELLPKQGSQAGLIQSATAGNLAMGRIDADSPEYLLLSQKNFARLLTFEDKQWKVVDQFNASGTGDEIASAGMYDLDQDGVREVVLLDKKNWQLQILKKDETQTFKLHDTIDIGNWDISGNFKLAYGAFNGGPEKQLVLFDGSKISLVSQTESAAFPKSLNTILSWETTIRDGRYAHLALGDVNSDGHTDIVLVEPQKKHIDILALDQSEPKPRLLEGTRFKLFEEKSYKQERSMSSAEPREMIIEDVTGDGAADIVTIMHDRIVIYPQDY